MKKLFIGCRVRLIGKWRGKSSRNPTGMEGVIVSRDPIGDQTKRVFEWLVITDSGQSVTADSFELEPLAPSGAASGILSYQELIDKLKEGSLEPLKD